MVVTIDTQDRVQALRDILECWEKGQTCLLLSPKEPQFVREALYSQAIQGEYSGPGTLLTTSGSIGMPRLVYHRLEAHIASAKAAQTLFPLDASCTVALDLPFFRVGGLAPIIRAQCFCAKLSFDISVCTHISLVPTQLKRRLYEKPKKARVVLVGGAPCPKSLLEEATAIGWPVFPTYGMTEFASQIATARDGTFRLFPLPHICFERAADGELLCSGPSSCEWLQKPYPTADLIEIVDDGSWNIIGRKKRVINSGGEKIHPERIEAALLGLPGVLNAAVVPIPDAEFGERPVAFIAGSMPDFSLLERKIPRFWLPEALFPWPDDFSSEAKPPYALLEQRANLISSGTALTTF